MLAGCATTKIAEVPVPVPVPCPVAVMPERPVLPEIKADLPPDEQVGQLRLALAKVMAYAMELEAKLRGYVPK